MMSEGCFRGFTEHTCERDCYVNLSQIEVIHHVGSSRNRGQVYFARCPLSSLSRRSLAGGVLGGAINPVSLGKLWNERQRERSSSKLKTRKAFG